METLLRREIRMYDETGRYYGGTTWTKKSTIAIITLDDSDACKGIVYEKIN